MTVAVAVWTVEVTGVCGAQAAGLLVTQAARLVFPKARRAVPKAPQAASRFPRPATRNQNPETVAESVAVTVAVSSR